MQTTNTQQNGFFGRLNNWMTPERAIAMQGIGQGLSQLAQGQPVNMGYAHQALAQRQRNAQMRQVLESSGIMERFGPDERAILATMPESAATKIIASTLFAPSPKPTDDMREYELARTQGYEGSFMDYQLGMRRAGSTTINNNLGSTGIDYGAPPKDMAWARNRDGSVRIDERGAPMAVIVRGSPSDVQQTNDLVTMASDAIDESAAADAAFEDETRKNSVVLEDIGRAQEKIENAPWYNPTTGMLGNILKNVGGTAAADVQALTDTIRANIGFDRLQAMREASPTGGALGNVTERELSQLQAVLGSLSQAQTETQLLENLDRLEGIYTDIMRKAAAYPNAAEYGFDGFVPETDQAPEDPTQMTDEQLMQRLLGGQ